MTIGLKVALSLMLLLPFRVVALENVLYLYCMFTLDAVFTLHRSTSFVSLSVLSYCCMDDRRTIIQ